MKKRILATFLSAVTLISCSSALAADYSDVNQSAWYASYVNKISELNAFSGYEDGTFRPDNQITQEEFIKTVVCLICGELNKVMHRQLKILGTVSGALGLFRILTRHLNWA